MEVPRRPPLTLVLPTPALSARRPQGAVRKSPTKTTGSVSEKDSGAEEAQLSSEEEETAEPPASNRKSVGTIIRVSSRDSFSEEISSASEEKLAEEASRRSEEEEAAAKERKAQRQQLAIQELIQTERNYLQMLQICSGDIRRNLLQLQVTNPPRQKNMYSSVF